MGHWLFQSQQEWGEGAAGSPRGTQTHGRSIIHGSPWACSEHWHPTCLNQTGPVSLMPLGKCEAQVKVGVRRVVGSGGGDGEGQIRKERRERWWGREKCPSSYSTDCCLKAVSTAAATYSISLSLALICSFFLSFLCQHSCFSLLYSDATISLIIKANVVFP